MDVYYFPNKEKKRCIKKRTLIDCLGSDSPKDRRLTGECDQSAFSTSITLQNVSRRPLRSRAGPDLPS